MRCTWSRTIIIGVAWISLFQAGFCQIIPNVTEKIHAAYAVLDTCQNEQGLRNACYQIIGIAQANGLKGEVLRGVIETQLLFNYFSETDSLRKWLQVGDSLLTEFKPEVRPSLYDSLNFRQHFHDGQYFHKIGNFEKAVQAYNWLWENWKTGLYDYPVTVFYTDLAMRWAAQITSNQGKYAESASYYWRCIRLYEIVSKENIPDQRVRIYAALADALCKNSQLEEAQKAWEKAFEVNKSNLSQPKEHLTAWRWSFDLHFARTISEITQFNRPDSASFYLNNTKALLPANSNTIQLAKVNFLEGLQAGMFGLPEAAVCKFRKTLEGLTKDAYTDLRYQAQFSLAKSYLEFDSDSALYWLDRTLMEVAPNFSQHELDVSNVLYKKYLLSGVALKTAYFLHKAKKYPEQSEFLQSAIENGALQLEILEHFRNEYALEADKMLLVANAYSGLEKYWEALLLKYQRTGDTSVIHQLYHLQSQAKSRVALEQLQEYSRLESAGIELRDLTQWSWLKNRAAVAEKQVMNAPAGSPDLSELRLKRAMAGQEFQQFTEQLNARYPALQLQKEKAEQEVNVPLVQQKLLDPNTALIEYFTGDSTIFAFVITQKSVRSIPLPRPAHLSEKVNALLAPITNSQTYGRAGWTEFSKWSDFFYRLLLEDALKTLDPEIDQLIIVPDGPLVALPFEILGQNNPSAQNFKTFPYLLRKYAVRYTSSVSLLLLQSRLSGQNSSTVPKYFAGFAPRYVEGIVFQEAAPSPDRGLGLGDPELPGAEQEVRTIATLLGGDAFVGDSIDAALFKREAPLYKVLLLAMHAAPDVQNPNMSRLYFASESRPCTRASELTTIDVQSMRLEADLVVLSACQTGVGQIKRGEGVLSLTRGFITAGARSVVMSLWKVPDSATGALMISFFKHLQSGARKDMALRQAKLDYLDNVEFAGRYNPCFWAGFVLMGGGEELLGR